MQHSLTKRPLMAYLNIDPQDINPLVQRHFSNYRSFFKKLFQVLAYRRSLWPCFIEAETRRVKTISETYVKGNQTDSYREFIVSKGMVAFARRHFNCPTLKGVPLENGLSPESPDNHSGYLETVVVGNEITTLINRMHSRITNFTLTLLEDSGWYQVDYGMSQYSYWAVNYGCEILNTDSCPYSGICQREGQRRCYYDFTKSGYCYED